MISRFLSCFQNRHVVLPVIHATSVDQAVLNSRVAQDGGCDGVFLINHSIDHDELLECRQAVSEALPGFWTGLNSLGRAPEQVMKMVPADLGGLWVDNAGVDDNTSTLECDRILQSRNNCQRTGLYFGGVAFKYQREVQFPHIAAHRASRVMDVVTTSGSGTGVAASVDKIRTMKAALGAFPLAIASGITPDNVIEYLPYADCFLVATGISDSFTSLNPRLVFELVQKVRSFV